MDSSLLVKVSTFDDDVKVKLKRRLEESRSVSNVKHLPGKAASSMQGKPVKVQTLTHSSGEHSCKPKEPWKYGNLHLDFKGIVDKLWA